jgi:hypothetical protein
MVLIVPRRRTDAPELLLATAEKSNPLLAVETVGNMTTKIH